jgi:hypothetical protein
VTAVDVPGKDQLVATLDTVITAVRAGAFDELSRSKPKLVVCPSLSGSLSA